MATMLGSLLVSLGLESGQFRSGLTDAEKQIRSAQRNFEQVGANLTRLGSRLSVAVSAPLIAMGVAAVRGAQAQAEAVGQVEAALRSMGDVSGKTADELARTADAMEMRSLYDADVILRQMTANLLTFGNISGDVFDRAQQSVLDLSTRMNGDLQGATIMVGRALNDPKNGLAALSRTGAVSRDFIDANKDMIASLVDTGRTAEAQSLILAELERQHRGAAQAAADTAPWRQAQVAIAQAGDAIGEAILPVLPVITDAIVRMANAFRDLSPQTQKAVVVIAALAATVGPLLVVIGLAVKAMAPFLAVIQVIGASGGIMVAAKAAIIGLGVALGPIALPLAALAAAGALIYANWDTIGPLLQRLWAIIRDTLGPPLQNLVATLREAFDALFNGPLGPVLRALGPIVTAFGRTALNVFGSVLVGAVTAAANAVAMMVNAIAGSIRILSRIFDSAMAKVRAVEGAFAWLYDRVVGNSHIPDMVDQIGAEMRRLDALMVNPAQAAAQSVDDAFRTMAGNVRGILARLFPDVAAANLYADERTALLSMPEGAARDAAVAALDRERALAEKSSAPQSSIAVALAEIPDALADAARDTEVQTVRIARSFQDMARDTLSALEGVANAIKGGGFLNILQSVIGLGLQLGGAGAFGSSIQGRLSAVPAFAGGTNFAPGGMAMVGERGPELVNLPRGSQVVPNHALGGSTRIEVIPSPYFDVRVNQNIGAAAPAIAEAGAQTGQARMARSNSRRWI